jgi:hypothetical protein
MRTLYDLKLNCVAVMDETVNDCALENSHIWSAEQVNELKVHGTASYVLDLGVGGDVR